MKHMKWIIGLALVLLLTVGLVVGAMGDGPKGPQSEYENDELLYDGIEHVLFSEPSDTDIYTYEYKDDNEVWEPYLPMVSRKDADRYTLEWKAKEIDAESFTYSGSFMVIINPRKINVDWTSDDISYEYNQSEQAPDPTLNNVISSDVNDVKPVITITGENATNGKAVNVGTYTAQVTGLSGDKAGNYVIYPTDEGKGFTITPKTITNEMVSDIADQTYTGSDIKPEPTVKDGDTTLTKDTDYKLSYPEDCINVNPSLEVTVVGMGNYSEQVSVNYSIVKAQLTISEWKWDATGDSTGTWPTDTIYYDGNEHVVSAVAECTTELASGVTPPVPAVSITPGETTVKNQGSYTATASIPADAAANFEWKNGINPTKEFSIAPYELTLTWSLDGTPGKTEAEYTAAEHQISVSADVKDDGTEVSSYIVSVTDAGTYTTTVAVSGDAIDNYTIADPSQDFTITPIALTLKWTMDGEEKTNCTYDTLSHEIKVTSDQILAADKDKVLLTPSTASITDAGEYVIEATKNEGGFYTYYIEGDTVIGETSGSESTTAEFTEYSNYKMPATVTQTFTIEKASLEGSEIVIAEGPYVYNGDEQKPAVTSVTVKDGTTPVATSEYEVTYSKNIDASEDTATVTVTAKENGNYADSESMTFTIEPKDIADATITIAKIDDQTYTGKAIEPELKVTDTARSNAELKKDTDFTVKYESNKLVADKPVITLTGTGNYTGTNDTATFIIVPLEAELEWADTDLTYNREAQIPKATVANIVEGDECEVTVSSEETKAGSYVATATALSNPNYKLPATVTQDWTIKRLPVAAIKVTVNGPSQDPARLGGPNADQYHTITLEGEPGEAFTATVSGGGTIKDKFGSDGKYTAKISGDALGGAALDGSGDKENTISVEYDDKANLTTAATASADAAEAAGASGSFIYDTTAKAITVHELYNRGERGVTVDLEEGYRKISFASTGAGEDFTAEATDMAAGAGQLVAFAVSNPKLNSTVRYESSYSGTYEDYVGNAGSVSGLEILQSSATVEILSVSPEINEAGRIAATGSFTFSVRMTAPGGYSEAATFFGAKNLAQGEQEIVISANQIHADAATTPSIAFDDLVGGTSFQTFTFDPVCDDPILTTEPTAGCYYMTGIAEPGSVVTVEVNGEKIRATADGYGTFVIPMPLTEEGDTVTMHITDTAGNTITREYTVGAEQDPVEMDAFMMGHTFTNAHGNKDGELKYAMVLTAKVDDLKNGKVSIPILAGNMVTVGTIDVVMDENGNLSYSYVLDDGVELIESEKVIANTKLDREAFLAMEGIEISKDGTYIEGIKNKTVYLCAKFKVKVPAEKLQDTFHTKKITESEMKRKYRDLQNGKIQ